MTPSSLLSPYLVGVGSRVIVQVAAFVQVMIAARYLDLTEFGSYALAWAVTVISISFVYTGFYQALLRSSDFEADKDTAFASMSVIGLLGSAALIGGSFLHAEPFSGSGLVFLLLAPFPTLRVLIAWCEVHLMRRKAVRIVSVNTAISECLSLIAVWISLTHGLGLFALVVGRAVAAVSEFTVIVGAVRKFPGLGITRRAFHRMRTTALPLWGTSALGLFSNYGSDLILGAFLNPGAVGTYRGGSRISQTATDLVSQPLTMLTWSRLSQLDNATQLDQIRHAWRTNIAIGAALLWPLLLSVAVMAEELIAVVFDEAWLAAAIVVVILSASRALRFLTVLLEPTMTCMDRGKTQMQIRLISAVVLLIGLLSFGRFSVVAACGAHFVASVVVAYLSLRAMLAVLELEWRDLVRDLMPAIIVSLVCGAAILASAGLRTGANPTWELISTIAAIASIWLICVLFFLRSGKIALPSA